MFVIVRLTFASAFDSLTWARREKFHGGSGWRNILKLLENKLQTMCRASMGQRIWTRPIAGECELSLQEIAAGS